LLYALRETHTEDAMTTFKRILVLTSVFVALAGCGPDGGGMQATEGPDAGGCQSSNPSEAAQAFIGSWRYVTQTLNCTCDDGTTQALSTSGSDIETFTAGCEPNQVIGLDSSSPTNCQEVCTVSGTTATCAPYTCGLSNGIEAQTTNDVYTLSNGQLQNIGGGTITMPNGTSCQCASNDGVLTKIQ
jgi:hypothetical protein